MSVSDQGEGARGFDFLGGGSWRVANRRLRSRLAGSDDWEEFEASMENSPILGGLGNVDRYRARRGGTDFEGFLLRLYDPKAGRWSIYWADSLGCELGPPVVGGFVAGACKLFGYDLRPDEMAGVAGPRVLLAQRRLDGVMAGSEASVAGELVTSLEYFRDMRSLCALLLAQGNRKTSASFRMPRCAPLVCTRGSVPNCACAAETWSTAAATGARAPVPDLTSDHRKAPR